MASGEALFNPYLPEFHADPYPFYHRLRAVAPVYQTPMGFWVLTRYDDVVTVLRDPRFGRDGFEQMLAAVYADDRAESSRLPRSMLFRDPPDHTRLRALVSKAFTPRVIERMREHIQDIVHRLLGRVRDAKGMDVITDLAYPLPVTVICEMLGVPTGDEAVIRQWSSDVARSLDAIGMPSDIEVVARGRAARRELGDYFRRLLPERRRRPQDALLSLLIAAEEAGDTLSEGELLATCVLLFIAGHETTVNLIGNGFAGPPAPSGPARAFAGRSGADSERGGGVAEVRQPGAADGAHHDHRRRGRRPHAREGLDGRGRDRRGQPRPGTLPGPGPSGYHASRQPAHRLRLWHPLLSRRAPGSARRADRLGHPPPRAARLGGRRDADLARIVDAARAQGAAGDVLAAARAPWRRSSPTRSKRSGAARTSPLSPPWCPTAPRRW